ncbi:D-alanyl-D-alanine carboxypeptidase (penicillin-binding protein 5/6) [Aestuariispira insulae]|uniref:serine-type D-Ala-D-Ala carboxypeptidase n=2 Tax=Aestuariispira insulae TaxID=1461337 RepID=A0A3D9HNM6_9PROT|nr:D-alanyl-D-alanine carboxypeptidase (penicillin-binding protein 5/6) [Aestuariispira insulae]
MPKFLQTEKIEKMSLLKSPLKLFASALLGTLIALPAHALETPAKQVLLIDHDTGAVLFEKNAEERMYPASMTKMMTAFMVFKQLKNGTLSLEDSFPVSKKAWKKGGSKMFVEVGKRVNIEDLLRGIIIQSGNDATIVVAEGISGSEESFAKEMTQTAREIGMFDSQFRNASGWPDPDHFTSAKDLAILASETIRSYGDYYHIYSEKEFTFSGIKQSNRNPLIRGDFDGADGLKTGHTEASGYGLTASAERDGRRLILVINGLDSQKARAVESERLLSWGFREWNRYPLFQAGETVGDAPVWLGQTGTVPMIVKKDILLTMRRKYRDDLKVSIRYNEPVPAPIAKDSILGTLVIEAPDMDTIETPLYAAEDVPQLGMFGRLSAAFEYLLWGEN